MFFLFQFYSLCGFDTNIQDIFTTDCEINKGHTTYLSAPSAAPVNITVFNTSANSIRIEWSNIKRIDENGIVRGFRIKYYALLEGPNTSKIITVPLESYTRKKRAVTYNLHSREIMGLDEYTEYVVQILGYTIEDGEYSSPFKVRTAEAGKWSKALILRNAKK